MQGSIPGSVSVTHATFVDFDGSYCFTGANNTSYMSEGAALGAIGAIPLDEAHLPLVLEAGHKAAAGYVKSNHATVPTPLAC